jgi:hypothetical protein
MNPYSHIVIASKLEAYLKPENLQEYYWGAIAPDIRYLAAMQRQQTHFPSRRIVEFISQYPHLKSFLQGYLVHCLSDEIDLGQVFFQHFPFSVLKSQMSRQQIAAILELFYFENEKVNKHISGTHNEILNELGLSEPVSMKFSQSLNQYAASSSPESRLLDLFQLLGLENDSRIEKYMTAAKSFQKNWLLKNALYLGIRTGKISEQIVLMVTSLLPAM